MSSTAQCGTEVQSKHPQNNSLEQQTRFETNKYTGSYK